MTRPAHRWQWLQVGILKRRQLATIQFIWAIANTHPWNRMTCAIVLLYAQYDWNWCVCVFLTYASAVLWLWEYIYDICTYMFYYTEDGYDKCALALWGTRQSTRTSVRMPFAKATVGKVSQYIFCKFDERFQQTRAHARKARSLDYWKEPTHANNIYGECWSIYSFSFNACVGCGKKVRTRSAASAAQRAHGFRSSHDGCHAGAVNA